MKLPLTQIPTNTGAISLFDADGVKVGTIRTDAVHAAHAINCGNANKIIYALNSHDTLVAALERAFIWFGKCGGNVAGGACRDEWLAARVALQAAGVEGL